MQLIEIENGTKRYMPWTHAIRAVDEQRAIIVDGKVRFLEPPSRDSDGYENTGSAIFVRQVKPSAGFSVLQYLKRYAPATQ